MSACAHQENYPDEVSGHLSQFVTYPAQAWRQGVEGNPVVRFKINRQGDILGVRIERSSNSSLLDNAAIQAVQYASPFPLVPAHLTGDSFEFVIPVCFSMKHGTVCSVEDYARE